MGIGVKREARVSVSENARKRFRIDSAFRCVGGKGVAEVMKADSRQLRIFEDIPESGVIQTPSYAIIEGANFVWTNNTDQALTFCANGDFSSFTGVKVDGILVPSDKYKAVSGSTVVSLNTDYLDSLSVGKHMLTVVYSDGECSTEFEIKSAANSNAEAPASPQIGDNSNLMLWFVFFPGALSLCLRQKSALSNSITNGSA